MEKALETWPNASSTASDSRTKQMSALPLFACGVTRTKPEAPRHLGQVEVLENGRLSWCFGVVLAYHEGLTPLKLMRIQ